MPPGLSLCDVDKIAENPDNSATLYFGPKAPKGLKSNWIPTTGKAPYAVFRFYGPEDELKNKSFVLPDVKMVRP